MKQYLTLCIIVAGCLFFGSVVAIVIAQIIGLI